MPRTPDIVSVSGENFFHFNLFYYILPLFFFVICTTGARESCDMSAKTWWMAEKRTCSKRPTSPGCWSARSIEYKWGNPVEKFNWKKALLWMTWWIFQFSILSLCRVAADGEVSCTIFIAMFRCSSQILFFFRGSMNISRLVPSSESRVIIIENKWEISSSSACSSSMSSFVSRRV